MKVGNLENEKKPTPTSPTKGGYAGIPPDTSHTVSGLARGGVRVADKKWCSLLKMRNDWVLQLTRLDEKKNNKQKKPKPSY